MFLLVLDSFSYTKKPKNKDAVYGSSRQSKFVFNTDGKITLTGDGKSKALSTEDQVVKAEIIRCIDIIDSNCAFRAADADNGKYRKMFPNSATANSYQQKADKVKYTIQFGIARHSCFVLTKQQLLKLKNSMMVMQPTTQSIWSNCNSLFGNTFSREMHC